MKLDKTVLDQVCKLAHLELDESEKDAYIHQLQLVLDHMDQLNQLDLEKASPSAWTENVTTPCQKDELRQDQLPHIEENAPEWENDCFRVPQILGGEE